MRKVMFVKIHVDEYGGQISVAHYAKGCQSPSVFLEVTKEPFMVADEILRVIDETQKQVKQES